jgi:hypothetical protein
MASDSFCPDIYLHGRKVEAGDDIQYRSSQKTFYFTV